LSTDAAIRFYHEELEVEWPPRRSLCIHSSAFEPPTYIDEPNDNYIDQDHEE
jgi:hypothetical protein